MASFGGRMQVCFNLRDQGKCRFGNNCRYSHDLSGSTSGAPRPPRPQGQSRRMPTVEERPYQEILRMIKDRTPLTPSQSQHFLKIGLEVMNTGTTDVKQSLIKELASENGLGRIRQFVEAKYEEESTGIRTMSFWKHCVPFLTLITHKELQSSLILEAAVGTIYTVLYGMSGARALPFFELVINYLSTNTTVGRTSDEYNKALYVISSALLMTLKANQSADIQQQFTDFAKTLRQCYPSAEPTDYEGRLAYDALQKIEQKLQIGNSVPTASAHPARQAATYFYQADVDFPGLQSKQGQRHNNDHASIEDIKILPTANEIQPSTEREEYIPFRDYSPQTHHLPPGMDRILDTQFRLLREDTTGQLRDAVRYVLQRLTTETKEVIRPNNGAQSILYRNVTLSDFVFDSRDGLQIEVSFDQPQRVAGQKLKERKAWWEASRYLQFGALVALVNTAGLCVFFTVTKRTVNNPPPEPPKEYDDGQPPAQQKPVRNLVNDSKTAFVCLKLTEELGDLRTVAKEFYRQRAIVPGSNGLQQEQPLFLVEFPGLLFASFQPILKSIQSLIGTAIVPFPRWIAPEGYEGQSNGLQIIELHGRKVIKVPPPLYLTKRAVRLDLGVITHSGERKRVMHSAQQPVNIATLMANTTLDNGQCEALIAALSHELALIQGPPGTGKSFVGVRLVQVLLDNRSKVDLGPIVCVCYTNHALDQFLVDLLEEGTKKLVRLGSRSKAPELENLTLRVISQSVTSTKTERQNVWNARQEIDAIQGRMTNLIERIRVGDKWTAVRDLLAMSYPHFHKQLFSRSQASDEEEMDDDGKEDSNPNQWREVSHRKPKQVLNDWVNMKMLPLETMARLGLRPRTLQEMLACERLSTLTSHERRRLKRHWEEEVKRNLILELKDEVMYFTRAKEELMNQYLERDRRCLQDAHVIGVTTTGLAHNAELLRSLKAKVLICEEAGEVLEAHVLTALLPSVEHAILIGDHEQLRPHIANYGLSMESREGKKYALDESLFERLIRQKYGTSSEARFPYATLDTQRRMHPAIASLVRETLYPDLRDHHKTFLHPSVPGMARRLFWMNHYQPEAGADQNDTGLSKSNQFEVDMVGGLVKHLLQQGCYGKGDIAVITPYLGQLKRLKKKLGGMFEVLVDERDQLQLDLAEEGEEGQEEEVEVTKLGRKPRPAENVKKGLLSNEVRMATVDNFQGEEAKVIIVSLVRCNPARKCGFLKTSNRINVLLSRARDGMYLIGNADTSRPVGMWSDVLSLLEAEGNYGDSFELRCPRHPGEPILIQQPDDFPRLSPAGGCHRVCAKRLEACGHTCVQKCHADHLHKIVVCMEECTRPLPGCEHACPVVCGKSCEKCKVPIPEVFLSCGHIAYNVECYKVQKPSEIKCTKSVRKIVPGCKHEHSVACYVDVAAPGFNCRQRCGKPLDCGHDCGAECYQCTKVQHGETEPKHRPCSSPCGRAFNTCQHSCTKRCHGQKPCGLCDAPCELRCSHSVCTKKCYEPCTPCAEKCTWTCAHRGECNMPCSVPCDILPCSKRCTLSLECGHQCPSLCGEVCPSTKYCRECANPEILETTVDFVTLETYKEIDLETNPIIFLSCGHFFCMETVDGLMELGKVYKMDKEGNIVSQLPPSEWATAIKPSQTRCPTCRGHLRNINRYNRVAKGVFIELLVKKFVATSTKDFLLLEGLASDIEKELNHTPTDTIIEGTPDDLPPEALIRRLYHVRYSGFLNLQKRVVAFTNSVAAEEQPYSRIHRLVVDSIRRSRIEESMFTVDDASVQLRSAVLGRALYLRINWAYIYDIFQLSNKLKTKAHQDKVREYIFKEVKKLMKSSLDLVEAARQATQPRQEVEGMIYHARFAGIELTLPLASERARIKAREARDRPMNPMDSEELRQQERNRLIMAVVNAEAVYEQEMMARRGLRTQEMDRLVKANEICIRLPGSTSGLSAVIVEVRRSLQSGEPFYSVVGTEELRQVYEAMRHELRGTGHWYYCENRHPFTIDRCGMPMELARCPQCQARIGGQNHTAVEGVTRADDIEAIATGTGTGTGTGTEPAIGGLRRMFARMGL